MKVTVVGHVAYDYIFMVERHAKLNQSSYITEWKKCYGGGAANIAVGIKKLGGKSKLYSVAGRDFKRYENYLKKIGVELDLYRSKKPTARAYIFNANGKQVMYFYWGASEKMEKMKAIKSNFLHIAPCHPKLALEMAEKTEFFAFEPGQDLKKFDKGSLAYMVEKADIIFCNEIELKEMEKKVGIKNKEVIVTLGKKGSMIYNKKLKIKAIPAKVVDATGAGDAYKAGFWVAFSKGYDIETCCKFGSVVASFIVEKIGAQNYPSWEKVEKRFSKHFGKV